jgi:hypothetical protein
MAILNFFKDKLLRLDLFGSKFELMHEGRTQIKSIIEGICTLGIIPFFIYIIFSIGNDIYYKQKPISRVNKEYNETAVITLKEYRYAFYFLEPVKGFKHANADKYFSMSASWYLFEIEKVQGNVNYPLFVEPCTANHVAPYETEFNANRDFNLTWCVNPSKFKNGTQIVEKDIYFLNEYSSVNSAFVIPV